MNAQLERRTGYDRRQAGTHGVERRFVNDRRAGSVRGKSIFARQSNESNDDYLERLFRLPI